MYLAPLCISGLGWRWFSPTPFHAATVPVASASGLLAGCIRAFFTGRSLSLLLPPISEPDAPLCVRRFLLRLSLCSTSALRFRGGLWRDSEGSSPVIGLLLLSLTFYPARSYSPGLRTHRYARGRHCCFVEGGGFEPPKPRRACAHLRRFHPGRSVSVTLSQPSYPYCAVRFPRTVCFASSFTVPCGFPARSVLLRLLLCRAVSPHGLFCFVFYCAVRFPRTVCFASSFAL